MKYLIVTLLVAALGFAAWKAVEARSTPAVEISTASLFKVKRDTLAITVTENGYLKAKNSLNMKPKFKRQGTINWLIEEGTEVVEGDILVEFEKKNDAFEVKGAFLDGNALGAEEVATLATLPSLLELRGKIAGLIQAPATKLVRLLSEPGSQLARLVGARRSALEEGGES